MILFLEWKVNLIKKWTNLQIFVFNAKHASKTRNHLPKLMSMWIIFEMPRLTLLIERCECAMFISELMCMRPGPPHELEWSIKFKRRQLKSFTKPKDRLWHLVDCSSLMLPSLVRNRWMSWLGVLCDDEVLTSSLNEKVYKALISV